MCSILRKRLVSHPEYFSNSLTLKRTSMDHKYLIHQLNTHLCDKLSWAILVIFLLNITMLWTGGKLKISSHNLHMLKDP